MGHGCPFKMININTLPSWFIKKSTGQYFTVFNLSSIVNFPTGVGPLFFLTINNVLLDKSYLKNFDIILYYIILY
jgi:hypothetical protein